MSGLHSVEKSDSSHKSVDHLRNSIIFLGRKLIDTLYFPGANHKFLTENNPFFTNIHEYLKQIIEVLRRSMHFWKELHAFLKEICGFLQKR